MFTLIIGTIILALTYGAFWQSQPAGKRDTEEAGRELRSGNLVNSILCWLLVMPQVGKPIVNEEPVVVPGEDRTPKDKALLFRRSPGAQPVCKPT